MHAHMPSYSFLSACDNLNAQGKLQTQDVRKEHRCTLEHEAATVISATLLGKCIKEQGYHSLVSFPSITKEGLTLGIWIMFESKLKEKNILISSES